MPNVLKRDHTRFQMDLHPAHKVRLDNLKERTAMPTYVEVVRNALRVYEAIVDETGDGSQFFVKRRDGHIVPFRMFIA